jgi:hypothetical protein
MDTNQAANHVGLEFFQAKRIILRLKRKLQKRNRTGTVVRAWQLGLISLPDEETIFRYAGLHHLEALNLEQQETACNTVSGEKENAYA